MEPGVVPPPPPTTAGDVVCDISEVLRDIAAKVGEQADAALVGGFAQPLKLDTVPAASGAPAGASSGTGAPAPPATGLKAQRLEYVPWSEPATSSAAAAAAAAAPAGGFATTTVQAPPVPAGASSAAHGIKIETAGSGLGESGSRGPVKADDMTDDLIHEALQVEVTSESCHMIRLINTQLLKLLDEGVVKYVTGDQNSVWGFQVLEVKDPLRFNKAFRQVTPPPRGNKPLIRPTEVKLRTSSASLGPLPPPPRVCVPALLACDCPKPQTLHQQPMPAPARSGAGCAGCQCARNMCLHPVHAMPTTPKPRAYILEPKTQTLNPTT